MGTQFLGATPGNSSTPSYQVLSGLNLPSFPTTGKNVYLDVVHGSDVNTGATPQNAVKTLAAGYALLRDGYNDILVVIGNGLSTGSVRLSAGFTWAKNAAHMIGICSPGMISPRARIAPTAAIAAFANFFTVSGSGCFFSNLEFYQGFATGVAAEICMTVSGGRNVFYKCHFAGMNDAVGAGDTGSRNLLVSGNVGENLFVECDVGDDTTARTAVNASVEFSGGSPRNIFRSCLFPVYATGSGSGAIILLTAAGAAIDRLTKFIYCQFLNPATLSGGVALAALATMAAAAGGGLYFKDCSRYGITAWYSDGTTKAQLLIDGYAASATAGLAINPS